MTDHAPIPPQLAAHLAQIGVATPPKPADIEAAVKHGVSMGWKPRIRRRANF